MPEYSIRFYNDANTHKLLDKINNNYVDKSINNQLTDNINDNINDNSNKLLIMLTHGYNYLVSLDNYKNYVIINESNYYVNKASGKLSKINDYNDTFNKNVLHIKNDIIYQIPSLDDQWILDKYYYEKSLTDSKYDNDNAKFYKYITNIETKQ